MVRKFFVALVGLTLVATAVPARASAQVIVSGPGAWLTTYATPVVVVSRSAAPLTYINADVYGHDVVATTAVGSDDAYWCDGDPSTTGRNYPIGKCPLFWTPLTSGGQSVQVDGIQATVVGKAYAFRCSPHANMTGLIVVVP